MSDEDLVRTRHALHAVAEQVLAGPQHRAHGTIRLRVVPGGFGTVSGPLLEVVGTDLVRGEDVHPLRGRSIRDLGEVLGLQTGAPDDVYDEGSVLGADEPLVLDPDAARVILAAYADGDAALRLLEPREEPVLWPEHFDVAIRVGGVNYGVSPGDTFLEQPYAYVGPDVVPEGDPFWNAPFGVARPMSELAGTAALHAFLAEGRQRSSS